MSKKQKKFFSILNLLLILLAFGFIELKIKAAEEEPVLARCIKKEETYLVTNKSYRYAPRVILTQELFNEVLSNNINFPIKQSILKQICALDADGNPKDASLLTLQYFMILKHDVLDLDKLPPEEVIRIKGFFSDALQSLPQIFLNYITSLIGNAPTAQCLEKEIPELANFLYQYKYLESEISPENDLLQLETLKPIFAKISLYREIYDKCEDELKKAAEKEKQNQKSPKKTHNPEI